MCGAGRRQGLVERLAHGLMDFAAVPEAHLDLGGVDIYVHPCWRQGQVQHIDGLPMTVEDVFVGAAGCMCHHLVAYIAMVDIGVLLIGT